VSKTFVLIHGSWHAGWTWQAVIRRLEAKGHRAYAPTLPGHEPRARRIGITYQDYVDSVVSYIKQHDLHDVILVGHSFGGPVISKVAEHLSNRIQRLIFLEAFVLQDNQCLNDILPGPFAQFSKQLAQTSADNTMTLPWEIWRNHFIPDASQEMARVLWEYLPPEPYQPALEKLDLKAFSRSISLKAILPAAKTSRCHRAFFILACPHAWAYTNSLRWMAVTRCCSHVPLK
jgi:pimeloyl-ACP methyl ester carboxylesterase